MCDSPKTACHEGEPCRSKSAGKIHRRSSQEPSLTVVCYGRQLERPTWISACRDPGGPLDPPSEGRLHFVAAICSKWLPLPRTRISAIPMEGLSEIWHDIVRRGRIYYTLKENLRRDGYHVVDGQPGHHWELWSTWRSSSHRWNRWGCYELVEDDMEWRGWHWWYGQWQSQPDTDDQGSEFLDIWAHQWSKLGYHVEFGSPGYEGELWRTLSNGEGEWNRWERFELVDDETMKWRGVHWCYGRWQTYPEKQLRNLRSIFEEHVRQGRLSVRDTWYLGEVAESFLESSRKRFEVEYAHPRQLWVTDRSKDEGSSLWRCLELVGEKWEFRREHRWYGRWQAAPQAGPLPAGP